jgi:Cof subfamily protein (haloacid dehalogenase superfamily)
LVLDIDGTLVNKSGLISDIDHKALDEARSRGIKISLSTGRAANASRHILNKLALDGPHIFFDGAVIYDYKENREIYSRFIPSEIVKQACDIALMENIPLDLFTATQFFVIKEGWRTDIRRDYFNLKARVADFHYIWQQEQIIKGGIVTGNLEDENQARSFESQFTNKLSFTWSMAPAFPKCNFINVNTLGVSKGKALEALASYMGLGLDEIAAIGDGANDISLLSKAGLGIAMQNSPPELKSIAKHITTDVEQSGVARAIHEYLL